MTLVSMQLAVVAGMLVLAARSRLLLEVGACGLRSSSAAPLGTSLTACAMASSLTFSISMSLVGTGPFNLADIAITVGVMLLLCATMQPSKVESGRLMDAAVCPHRAQHRQQGVKQQNVEPW